MTTVQAVQKALIITRYAYISQVGEAIHAIVRHFLEPTVQITAKIQDDEGCVSMWVLRNTGIPQFLPASSNVPKSLEAKHSKIVRTIFALRSIGQGNQIAGVTKLYTNTKYSIVAAPPTESFMVSVRQHYLIVEETYVEVADNEGTSTAWLWDKKNRGILTYSDFLRYTKRIEELEKHEVIAKAMYKRHLAGVKS